MTEEHAPGHLLVLLGDLTRLACHAVVVPTSRELDVAAPWVDLVPLKSRKPNGAGWYAVDLQAPPGWGHEDRVLQAPEVDGRQVWLVRTDAWRKDGDWVAQGLVQAVERAAALLDPPQDRARPLIGVPLAGTGAGGLTARRGEVVSVLVPALAAVARRTGVDVALVLHDEQDHAAVQALRSADGGPARDVLDDAERSRADQLGELAAAGHLVLFLGAGVSLAAGLPTWSGLLQELTTTSGLQDLGLDTLAAPDAAQVLKDELGERFPGFMQERFTLERHAVAHALLAGLRVESVVTTNYDNGYELAAASCAGHGRLRVLPREHAVAGSPWLLKMHGDVAVPDSIVLTRQHYLEYADGRAPLTGMVQALLMTRHMLFVGFSLVDDNFARLAHQVRRVLTAAEPLDRKVGTVLALHADQARERLWRAELDQVSMAPAAVPGDETSQARYAARRLEVFLDRVAWRAATSRGGSEVHLLDHRYDAVQRSKPEADLREQLRVLQSSVSAESRATQAWAVVERALKGLGDGR